MRNGLRHFPGRSGPASSLARLDRETWRRVSASMVAARIRALLNMDARSLLRDCPCPVLCLAVSDDGIVPLRNVEEIVAVRPSVDVRIIEGRHFAMYTNPTAAGDVITRSMADTSISVGARRRVDNVENSMARSKKKGR